MYRYENVQPAAFKINDHKSRCLEKVKTDNLKQINASIQDQYIEELLGAIHNNRFGRIYMHETVKLVNLVQKFL